MPTSLLIAITVLAGAFGNVLMKIGTGKLPTITFSTASLSGIFTSPYIILGAALMIGTFPFYNMVLQRLSLTIAFPLITSLMFVTATIISVLLLKETLTIVQVFGLILVIAGLFLVAR